MKKLMLIGLLLTGTPLLAAEAPAAATTAPSAAIPWSSLGAEQQRLLAQFESRWDRLPPQR